MGGILANETTQPILPCFSVPETLAFYEMLGFRTTSRQERPYTYVVVAYSGFEVHFRDWVKGKEPADEDAGAMIVFVDDVAAYHAAFVAAMRAAHGKVLAKGLPRITRFRPGASRFSLYDPSGNLIIVIQRGEPKKLEYGGSTALAGLEKVLDNARILRGFKNDDKAAYRALRSGLRKHSDASPGDRAVALTTIIGLAGALGEDATDYEQELAGLELDDADQERVTEAGQEFADG